MPPANPASPANTADREIVITRVFDAPRELVFEAFTDPAHLPHWWGPQGFTITTQAAEIRPGGSWRFVMHGPDGTDYDNLIFYREIVRPERMVYDHSGGSVEECGQFVTTVTFEAQAGKTKLTMRALFRSKEERNDVIAKHNAVEGGQQTMDRLGAHLATLASNPAPDAPENEIVTSRVFRLPRETLFTAFSDPVRLAQWWGPKGFTNTMQQFDLKAGGTWRLTMHAPKGADYHNRSVFTEVTRPERIVYEHLEPIHRFQMTMTFEAVDNYTRLTWRMRFKTADEVAKVKAFILVANEQNFDRLAAHLSSPTY